MLDAYLELPAGALRPYVTAGIGASYLDLSLDIEVGDIGILSANDEVGIISAQVGAGLIFALSEDLMLDLRYRYLLGQDPELGNITLDYTSHNVMGGLRIEF